MDQRYLRPPNGFEIEGYMPFLRYLFALVLVIGAILTVASLIYLAVSLIKAVYGVSPFKSKYVKIAICGLVIGLMLFCGGWMGWFKFFHNVISPTKIIH